MIKLREFVFKHQELFTILGLSVLFYFWQFICIAAFKRIMPTTFNGGVFEWFIVLIVLYCLSFTIIKLSEIKSFRFLKMLF